VYRYLQDKLTHKQQDAQQKWSITCRLYRQNTNVLYLWTSASQEKAYSLITSTNTNEWMEALRGNGALVESTKNMVVIINKLKNLWTLRQTVIVEVLVCKRE
jgi:TATA-binding related factor (TRF) of subunit 20 of Mediator complex